MQWTDHRDETISRARRRARDVRSGMSSRQPERDGGKDNGTPEGGIADGRAEYADPRAPNRNNINPPPGGIVRAHIEPVVLWSGPSSTISATCFPDQRRSMSAGSSVGGTGTLSSDVTAVSRRACVTSFDTPGHVQIPRRTTVRPLRNVLERFVPSWSFQR